ncbi:Swarming motility protein YbiA [Leucoagaricus sp. SymC.cos]|nr:Swarming motility protein YbiA [Leucoagaricus sp. SymC.cos]
MSYRKRMTVYTSQVGLSVPTVTTTPASPTGNPPIRSRVGERARTIYVTSDVPPSQWDHQDSFFPQVGDRTEPMRRTRSKVQTQYIITEETSGTSQPLSAPAILTTQRSRRSNPPSPLPPSPKTRVPRGPRPRILFYHKHDPHYGFTNFSPHPVHYNGKVYPTSEHLFQSFKARMDEAIYHKFTQHNDLRAELLATGDAELMEDSDKDSFWGIGADRKGSNELGKALERLRSRLRREGW